MGAYEEERGWPNQDIRYVVNYFNVCCTYVSTTAAPDKPICKLLLLYRNEILRGMLISCVGGSTAVGAVYVAATLLLIHRPHGMSFRILFFTLLTPLFRATITVKVNFLQFNWFTLLLTQ